VPFELGLRVALAQADAESVPDTECDGVALIVALPHVDGEADNDCVGLELAHAERDGVPETDGVPLALPHDE